MAINYDELYALYCRYLAHINSVEIDIPTEADDSAIMKTEQVILTIVSDWYIDSPRFSNNSPFHMELFDSISFEMDILCDALSSNEYKIAKGSLEHYLTLKYWQKTVCQQLEIGMDYINRFFAEEKALQRYLTTLETEENRISASIDEILKESKEPERKIDEYVINEIRAIIGTPRPNDCMLELNSSETKYVEEKIKLVERVYGRSVELKKQQNNPTLLFLNKVCA